VEGQPGIVVAAAVAEGAEDAGMSEHVAQRRDGSGHRHPDDLVPEAHRHAVPGQQP